MNTRPEIWKKAHALDPKFTAEQIQEWKASGFDVEQELVDALKAEILAEEASEAGMTVEVYLEHRKSEDAKILETLRALTK